MYQTNFPVIDLVATGENILRLRKEKGLSVRDLQGYFGFEEPQAIYKWQKGKSLPTVDNLYALSALLDVPMDHIIVPTCLSQTEYRYRAAGFVLLLKSFYRSAVLDTAEFRIVQTNCDTAKRHDAILRCLLII